MSSNLHRNSTEANKHTPKGFDLADNNSTLLRDERGQSRYIDNLVNERVENLVDGFNAPPTTTSGHLYVLIDEGSGTVNTDWNGASYNDIVRIQDGVWVSITPVNGYLVFNKTDEKYYKFGSSGWVEFIPESENIYTNDGTIGSNRVATLTDTLSFSGGRVSFDTTTNGILLPRVTTLQMNGIATPSTNELVFNTDLNGLYRYNGSSWVALSSGYGIIGVYSGTGNGTPVFFADLQSALETCKASGGYFTVKLYSNITITSAIQIEYTGSGVGNAYQFRQLTIDFNGFSITNAQANTSEGFDVRLSNSASVYQEIKFINGAVLRTNGTGTHHALKIDQASRYGTVQMQGMFLYCQNSRCASINLAPTSTATGINKVCDLGGSTFVSQNSFALVASNTAQIIKNFSCISHSSIATISTAGGILLNFTSENTSSGGGLVTSGSAIATNFSIKCNTGTAVKAEATSELSNFDAKSTSGYAIFAELFNGIMNGFTAKTGNTHALYFTGGGQISNGKCINNSSLATYFVNNFDTIHNIEGVNSGSGNGAFIGNSNSGARAEATFCKAVSIGGIGALIDASTGANRIVNVDNCTFVSHWDNAGGHGVRVQSTTAGTINITNSHIKIRNSGANAINALSAITVNSRYCTHNDVASTPINANVTIVSSGIIS